METKWNQRGKFLAAVALIAAFSLGGIRAYMTDHETAVNEFTVGKVDFNLYESSWDGEGPDGSYITTDSNALGINQAKNIYSGKVIDKNPAVKNNSKNDAYFRMYVRIPVASVVTADRSGRVLNGGMAVETDLFTYTENAGTGMRRISDYYEGGVASDSNAGRKYHVYEYAYTGGGWTEIPLPAGQDIPALFNQVAFANVIEGQVDGNLEFIKVDFKAIQSGGFASPSEAWLTYGRQNP